MKLLIALCLEQDDPKEASVEIPLASGGTVTLTHLSAQAHVEVGEITKLVAPSE